MSTLDENFFKYRKHIYKTSILLKDKRYHAKCPLCGREIYLKRKNIKCKKCKCGFKFNIFDLSSIEFPKIVSKIPNCLESNVSLINTEQRCEGQIYYMDFDCKLGFVKNNQTSTNSSNEES